MVGRRCGGASLSLRQRVADFETLRQVTKQGGAFPGQHAGQPMSHEHQDEFALALALKLCCLRRSTSPATWRSFTWPEGMPGKHGLGAVRGRKAIRRRCTLARHGVEPPPFLRRAERLRENRLIASIHPENPVHPAGSY